MKKLLAGGLSALMLLGSLGVVANAADIRYDDTYTIGDVDGSGSVDLKDSCLLKGCIVGDAKCLEAANTDAGDLVADGVINTRDSFQLKKLLLGMITEESLESDAQIYKLTIGGTDISEFTIYTPDDPTYDPQNPSKNRDFDDNNATYAGLMLREYIEKATGVWLTVAKLEGDTVPAGHSIIMHEVERHTEENDGNTPLAEKLGSENYMYKVENGNLEIWGTYRGNTYAVYEILEDYLGFRFTSSNYVFEYKSRYVDIPEGTDVFFEPVLKFRHCGQDMGRSSDNYAKPRRMNSSVVGPQMANAHSYQLYTEMSIGEADDDLLETNPAQYYEDKYDDGVEKFKATGHTQYNWQPCMSYMTIEEYGEDGYEDYLEFDCDYLKVLDGLYLTIARIMSWNNRQYQFNGHVRKNVLDGDKSMSFSQNDNIMNCKCSYCSAKANGKMDIVNGLDKFIGKPEGYSGIYIEASNRAVETLQEDFPGLRVHTILYDHTVPYSIRPGKHVNVWFCGQGCNNHHLGTDDCGDCYGQVCQVEGHGNINNKDTNRSLKEWGKMCSESGAQLWFWYYGVQYHYYVTPLPNVLNLYYDIKFLCEECYCKGIYYEGCSGSIYNLETVKAYMAAKMMWEPGMSYEQYVAYLKEYLYIHFGEGYEELFKFIEMQDTAGKKCGTCFISNFDSPGDCYSYKYIRDNYEEMRALLVTAYEKAEYSEQRQYIDTLIDCFDFLGLSCSYWKMYHGQGVDSEAEKDELKALYEERYTHMYNNLKNKGIQLYTGGGANLPYEISFDESPAVQVYGDGWTNRPEIWEFMSKGIESDAVES